MDFKKLNRYNEGRPKLNVPQRGDTPPRGSLAVQPAASNGKSSAAHSRRATRKSATIAQIRQFVSVKKNIIIAIVVVVTVAGSLSAEAIRQHNIDTTTSSAVDPNKIVENLEYQTVIPGGKSISDLGGWRRISPADSAPVFAYADKIDGISISVSQQPLPESFKGDTPGQLAELAKKFSATTKIDVDGSKMYIGTSAKGPQSALFTKNGLLILIKSQEKVDDGAWIKYAKSLN